MIVDNTPDLNHLGWEHIGKSLPPDVFLVGYPKSGNTWMQYLVAGLAYGCNPSVTPDAIVQELVPDVHSKKYYRRFGPRAFFKSHHFPENYHRRIIYILRDGRDAMTSYFKMTKALLRRDIQFKDFLQHANHFPGKWHEHVEKWLSNPYDADLMVVRYEDLLGNRVREMQRICNFIGIHPNESWLLQVSEEIRFENMQAKERLQGWDDPDWPKEEMFFRRGIIGSYRDEMPSEALQLFLSEASPTLSRLGYLPLSRESQD